MILQSLYDYYQRKAADPDGGMSPEGFEWKEIPFVVVIEPDGRFVGIEDTREGSGKARRAKVLLVPKSSQRSGARSYEVTNCLWDHIGYLFCQPRSDTPKHRELAKRQHATWLKVLHALGTELSASPSVKAICEFYTRQQVDMVKAHPLWAECMGVVGCNATFRISTSPVPVPCEESVRAGILARLSRSVADGGPSGNGSVDEVRIGRCLVTGDTTEIARLHTKTPISKDSKSLVGFQRASGYDSYGKEQAFNAPVGKRAEFAYTTALSHLLGRDSKNRVQVGDATTVFWSDRRTELEDSFFSFWSVDRDDPDRGIRAVETLLKSPQTGAAIPEGDARFFVLGLSPNAARISVRFWHACSVVELSAHLRQHFVDLDLIRPKADKGSNALFFLLSDLALEGKIENIPPNVAGNTMRAILTGGPYPATLLQQAIRRIRATRKLKRTQVAVLKACLNRQRRFQPAPTEKEIEVSLDPDNMNPGYRLGRLFAALEKIQEDAQPGITATIRERFYGAACSSPVSVFPQLLKLKNHHISKIDNGAFRHTHERRLTEIFAGLPPSMPAHLSMDDQARFAIGYYHQRQAFFAKSENSDQ